MVSDIQSSKPFHWLIRAVSLAWWSAAFFRSHAWTTLDDPRTQSHHVIDVMHICGACYCAQFQAYPGSKQYQTKYKLGSILCLIQLPYLQATLLSFPVEKGRAGHAWSWDAKELKSLASDACSCAVRDMKRSCLSLDKFGQIWTNLQAFLTSYGHPSLALRCCHPCCCPLEVLALQKQVGKKACWQSELAHS